MWAWDMAGGTLAGVRVLVWCMLKQGGMAGWMGTCACLHALPAEACTNGSWRSLCRGVNRSTCCHGWHASPLLMPAHADRLCAMHCWVTAGIHMQPLPRTQAPATGEAPAPLFIPCILLQPTATPSKSVSHNLTLLTPPRCGWRRKRPAGARTRRRGRWGACTRPSSRC